MRPQGLTPRPTSTCNRRKSALLARRSARATASWHQLPQYVSCTGKRTTLSENPSTRLGCQYSYAVAVDPTYDLLAVVASRWVRASVATLPDCHTSKGGRNDHAHSWYLSLLP